MRPGEPFLPAEPKSISIYPLEESDRGARWIVRRMVAPVALSATDPVVSSLDLIAGMMDATAVVTVATLSALAPQMYIPGHHG
jgi:hypothetical protein